MTKSIETNRDWRQMWSNIVKRVGADEFLRQVERTVAGKPIEDTQIDLCMDAIRTALELKPTDTLLDLCCGNGLITRRLSTDCRHIIGVDFSQGLIDVARSNFAAENITYVCGSATDISLTELNDFLPNKVVMCAALQCFGENELRRLMSRIGMLSMNGIPVLFTDVPDVECLDKFYNTPERKAEFTRRRAEGSEAIGTWWSKEHLDKILAEFNYGAGFIVQNPLRSEAHYRFDLLAQQI